MSGHVGVQQYLGGLETLLNRGSWIPIVHFVTGAMRGVLAKIQIVMSIAMICLRIALALVITDRSLPWKIKQSLIFLDHGLANLFRAGIEILPYSCYATLSYDALIGRYNYPEETKPHDVYFLKEHVGKIV
jgi:hypothetical protein